MSKLFWDIREEHELMEKLRASDPTGKWVSDFVHSDNPKFAGKSKKERIRMALGAAYAAKRQNEDNNHIVEATHRIGLTVTDPNHPMVSKRKETIQKTVRVDGEDRESAIKRAMAHYRRKGYKVHDHHYIGTVNEEVELVEKYTENDIANGGTVIYKHAGKHYMSKVSHKTGAGAGTKIHTTSALGHVVPLHHIVSTDASDWNTYKNRPVKEEVEIDEAAWGKDKMANLQAAHDRHSEKAIAANRAGDDAAVKVHQSKMNMIKNQMNKLRKEDVEQVDELRTSTLLRYATKANKALIGGDRSKEEKRIKGIQKANYKIQTRHRVKEEAESTNEGAQQLLRKYVPGYAKRQIDKKMDAGKFGKDDVAKDANFYRYKKIQDKLKKEETNLDETPAYTKDDAYSGFGSIKPHRTLKVANVLKPEKDATSRAERLMAKAGVRTNEAKSLYDRHQELRKKSGLPDPSYYLKRMKEKQAEIEALRNQGSTEHLHGISHDAHPGAQKTFAGQVKK